ncbi:MAG: UDP-glucose/GDP-mannose dehydrogenase family protein [Spirochaetales bacterium]|nr:UDP-glucose/GDP-mannose dehydrogenase family protein [Spirochaetales bacterium]
MKLAVVGTGYVGLVAGTCFSEYGNVVYCVDIDERKIQGLKKNQLPIYEPGLAEMVERNQKAGRLLFTTDIKEAVEVCEILFIAVGTPGKADGRPDISGVLNVAREAGRHAPGPRIIVDKSTVPVGMADLVKKAASEHSRHPIFVVSNPEFLREGHALEDFLYPERVVIGADDPVAARKMQELYAPFVKKTDNPILLMSIKSAELTKYACNSFLALKISFANMIANLCTAMGANYNDVKRGLGSDTRIGKKFLNAGIGYGGSCFPKDVRALIQMAEDAGVQVPMLREVEALNESQKKRLVDMVCEHYGSADLRGKTFAVWGLAFKPDTDDMREAPSLSVLPALLAAGAQVRAHDPVAMDVARPLLPAGVTMGDPFSILEQADALLILTEWRDYQEVDLNLVGNRLKSKVIFDGRNMYPPGQLKAMGFTYYGIGNHPEHLTLLEGML